MLVLLVGVGVDIDVCYYRTGLQVPSERHDGLEIMTDQNIRSALLLCSPEASIFQSAISSQVLHHSIKAGEQSHDMRIVT